MIDILFNEQKKNRLFRFKNKNVFIFQKVACYTHTHIHSQGITLKETSW